jgi:dephospho-CoA kinase
MRTEEQNRGLRIGLTGGIGCGKSTVAGLFAEAGWSVVSTDALVRDLLGKDPAVIEAIRKRWGAAVFDEAGCVDRGAVAKEVFSRGDGLEWLEALLHPRVRERWLAMVQAKAAANWLVEIPLLFEKRLEKEFDFSVCVNCPEAIVVARMALRGFSRVAVEQRSKWQMALPEKVERADYVITNAGSLEFLKAQTLDLIAEL